MYQCAAWCAGMTRNQRVLEARVFHREPPDEKEISKLQEEERRYRLLAAEHYRAAVEQNRCGGASAARLSFLVGELHRRLGDEVMAKEWLGKVSGLAADAESDRWIADLAHQQMTDPREHIIQKAAPGKPTQRSGTES